MLKVVSTRKDFVDSRPETCQLASTIKSDGEKSSLEDVEEHEFTLHEAKRLFWWLVDSKSNNSR